MGRKMRITTWMVGLLAGAVFFLSPAYAGFQAGELELTVVAPASPETSFGPTDVIQITGLLSNRSNDKEFDPSQIQTEFMFVGNILSAGGPFPYTLNFGPGIDFSLSAGEESEFQFGTLEPAASSVPLDVYASPGIGFVSEQLDDDRFPIIAGGPALLNLNGVEFTVVPLPAALWLVLSGLGVVALFSRKSSR